MTSVALSLGGGRLRAVLHPGPPDTPFVVCESGLGGDHFTWDRVVPLLKDRVSVVTYDRPGYGDSPARRGPTTLAGLADDLAAVVRETCGAQPFVLVGHSLGGRIARATAGLLPREQLKGLVLLEGAFDGVPTDFPAVDRAQRRLLKGMAFFGMLGVFRLPAVKAKLLAKAGYVDANSDGARSMLRNVNSRAFRSATSKEWLTMGEPVDSPRTDLPAIELIAETWKEWGGDAQRRHQVTAATLLDRLEEHFVHTFPHGEVRRLSDTGHGIASDRPDAVAQAILDILGMD